VARRRKKTRSAARSRAKAKGRAAPAFDATPPSGGAPEHSVSHADARARESEVEELLDRGVATRALALAKELHRASPSESTRTLLIRAYLNRAESLAAKGLDKEASALLELVERGFADAREPIRRLRLRFALQARRVDEVVAALADPTLSDGARAEIEDAVEKHLWDPSALAHAHSLPSDHPLRIAAGAVAEAFARVTTRAVTDVEVALPEVSRRSPLAPWKWLVRALAAFHREDDGECELMLARIPPDSAPARAALELRALCEGETAAGRSRLAGRVLARSDKLQSALANVDRAFAIGDSSELVSSVRAAIRRVASEAPELQERLLGRVEAYAITHHFDVHSVRRAIGRKPKRDAAYLRCIAKSVEEAMDLPAALAAPFWIGFARAAAAEGLFSRESLEAAAVYRHTASLLERYTGDELDELFDDEELLALAREPSRKPDSESRPRGQRRTRARSTGASGFPERDPLWLHAQACSWDPSPEGFRAWIETARTCDDEKQVEQAAAAWSAAHPDDPAPLLMRMESAERRGALRKALGLLEQAAQCNALDSGVVRARRRLQIKTAHRHIIDLKPRLLARDIAALEGALAEASPVEASAAGPALVLATLRCAHAVLTRDDDEVERHREALQTELGDPSAVGLALRSLARVQLQQLESGAAEARARKRSSRSSGGRPNAALVAAAARVSLLCRAFELRFDTNEAELEALCAALRATVPGTIESRSLCALGECALDVDRSELAHLVSRVGLQRRDPFEARFLLLRGRTLAGLDSERAVRCLDAVIAVAQRDRDASLLTAAVDARRDIAELGAPEPESRVDVEAVLAAERKAKLLPKRSRRGRHSDAHCSCPRCELDRIYRDLQGQAKRRGMSPEELLDEVLGEPPGTASPRALAELEEDPFAEPEPDPCDAFLADIEGASVTRVRGLPPRLTSLLLEAAMKYGPTPRQVPWMRVLAERNPELYEKLRAEAALAFPPEEPDRDSRSERRARGRRRKH